MSDLPAMSFGQFIKAKREELGYTVAEAAKKSGLFNGSIRNYESDNCRPFANSLYKLASAYGLTANDLQPYELKHKKYVGLKPVAKVQYSIRKAVKDTVIHMAGNGQFEQKMRNKLLSALAQCDEILGGVAFLDDAF